MNMELSSAIAETCQAQSVILEASWDMDQNDAFYGKVIDCIDSFEEIEDLLESAGSIEKGSDEAKTLIQNMEDILSVLSEIETGMDKLNSFYDDFIYAKDCIENSLKIFFELFEV